MNLPKLAKWSLGTAIILATLVAFFYSVIFFWGRREWANTQAALKAKGETLNIWSLASPELPEADNFFSAPLWKALQASEDASKKDPRFLAIQKALGAVMPLGKGLAAYKDSFPLEKAANYYLGNDLAPIPGESPADTVLRRLSEADNSIAEIRDAAARPGSRMPLDYDLGLNITMPHVVYILQAGQFLFVRAAAFAAKGDGERAKEDVLLQIRLSEALASEPFALSQLVRLNIVEMACQSIWTGLDNHCWDDAQIAQIESQLASISLREGLVLALRGDRALFIKAGEQYSRKGGMTALSENLSPPGSGLNPFPIRPSIYSSAYPAGLILSDLSYLCLTSQRAIDAANANSSLLEVANMLKQGARNRPQWIIPLSSWGLPVDARLADRFQTAEVRLNEALIACALARYQLRFGKYPDSLDKLPGLPNDSSCGKAFRYEPTPEGGYRLWSIGSDGKDDRGKPFDERTGTGDWAWIIPGRR